MLLGSLKSLSPACSLPCNNNNLLGRCLPGPQSHVGDAGRRGPKDLTFSTDSSSSGRKCNGQLGDDLSWSTTTYLPTVSLPWQFPTALSPHELLYCAGLSESSSTKKYFACLPVERSLPQNVLDFVLTEHCGAEQHSQHALILLLIPALPFFKHFSPLAFAALLEEKTLNFFWFFFRCSEL